MRVVNDQEKMLKLKLFGSFQMLLTSHEMNHEMVKIKNLIMILHFAVIWLDGRNSLLIFFELHKYIFRNTKSSSMFVQLIAKKMSNQKKILHQISTLFTYLSLSSWSLLLSLELKANKKTGHLTELNNRCIFTVHENYVIKMTRR